MKIMPNSELIYSVGSTSSSCTFGNLIEYVHQDILTKFPQNFFRHEHIATTLAFRQMKRYMDNTRQELRKNQKPMLIIKPAFEVSDDTVPFRDSPLTKNVWSSPDGMSRKSILPFIKDTHRMYQLGYRMNRDKLAFDVVVAVNTLVKQLDVYKSMENTIGFNAPYFQNASLETAIPIQMIEYIGKIIHCELDITRPETIPPILQYLQTHSNYPITYKIRNSTSVPEFFMYYNVGILTEYQDLTIDSGSKKGMTDDVYTISFRVTVEFNHPGAFILIGADIPLYRKFNFDIMIKDTPSDTFIPIFTMDRIFEEKNEFFDGYKLYTSTLVKTDEENRGHVDTVDLREVIEPQFIPIIRKYNFSDIPIDILFKVKLYKGKGVELAISEEFDVDWNMMTVNILKSDPNETYRIIIYQNKIRCNEELLQAEEMSRNDKTYDSIYNSRNLNDYSPEISLKKNNPYRK